MQPAAAPPAAPAKKKPSYLEAREYESIEQRVHAAEELLEQKRAALKDPSIARDGRLIEQAYREVEEAQAAVDAIYARWAELEQKMA
jgi:ATP-binding cassette subfamily F protein uup